MTQRSRSRFIASILPYIQQIAARRAAGTVDRHDREDAEADFIARAWEIYTSLARQEAEPALCRVLCALYRPEPPWTHRPEPDFKMLSMASPTIRLMAEAVPA